MNLVLVHSFWGHLGMGEGYTEALYRLACCSWSTLLTANLTCRAMWRKLKKTIVLKSPKKIYSCGLISKWFEKNSTKNFRENGCSNPLYDFVCFYWSFPLMVNPNGRARYNELDWKPLVKSQKKVMFLQFGVKMSQAETMPKIF